MQLKTILNHLQKQPGFVYGDPRLIRHATSTKIDVPIRVRRGSRPVCSGCGKKRPAYDQLEERRFEFVPLWAIPVFFVYTPRALRVS